MPVKRTFGYFFLVGRGEVFPRHWLALRDTPVTCPYCESNRVYRTSLGGHLFSGTIGYAPRSPIEATIMQRPERKNVKNPENEKIACPSEGLFALCPILWAFITDGVYDDGSPRKLSQLSMGLYDGNFRLALNDPNREASVYTSAASLEDAMQTMEHALQTESVRWYEWKRGKKPSAK